MAPGADVVIVNFRSPEMTRVCARAAAQAAAVERVVVVDNASGDGSVERLRAEGLEVLARPVNDGFAAGVNAGFAATRGDVVILLNPDTEPAPAALDALVAHLRAHPETAIVAPRLVGPDGVEQPNGHARFPDLWILVGDLAVPLAHLMAHLPWLDRYRAPASARRVAHVTGAALAVRRAAYEDAGPLDEGFFLYLEETEWQERVRARGWEIDRLPEVSVVHHVRGGGEESDTPSEHFVHSAVRYLVLHGHSPQAARAAVGLALLSSRVALRVIALLPSKRARSSRQARAFDALWRAFRRGQAQAPRAPAAAAR